MSVTNPANTAPGPSPTDHGWASPILTSKISVLSKVASSAKDALFLATLSVAISGFFGGVAMKFGWPIFIEQLRQDLNVVTKDDLSRLETQLNQVTGEDRLIRMPPGHSFIREPISIGEQVELTWVIGETLRGNKCNLLEITPLFIDERSIPMAGPTLVPTAQLQMEARRFQLDLVPPAALQEGRVALNLSLKFSCPFGPDGAYIDVYEETASVFFRLDP